MYQPVRLTPILVCTPACRQAGKNFLKFESLIIFDGGEELLQKRKPLMGNIFSCCVFGFLIWQI